jgi:hypothetical protein
MSIKKTNCLMLLIVFPTLLFGRSGSLNRCIDFESNRAERKPHILCKNKHAIEFTLIREKKGSLIDKKDTTGLSNRNAITEDKTGAAFFKQRTLFVGQIREEVVFDSIRFLDYDKEKRGRTKTMLVDTATTPVNLFESEKKSDKPQKKFWRYLGITPLADTNAKVKDGVYFAPLVFYTPDTRWAYGFAGAYIFHAKDKKNTDSPYATRASYFRFTANYTQNKQSDFWSEWSIFTNREKYYLKGELRMKSFPDKFYGLGNNSDKKEKEVYSYKLVAFKFLCLKQVIPKLFAGFDYHYTKEFNFKIEPNRTLATGNIVGNKGGTGSALGLVTIYDKRDNVMNPYEGQYAEFSSYLYRTAIGGSFNFTAINAEYRKYIKLKAKHIIAFQAKSRVSFGNVPFLEMSQVGNDDLLRSYPRNRYRDKNLFATQLEYRFPLFWRFGMTTFAGAGDVYNRFQDFKIKRLKYTLGMGLRFLMNTAERLNVRVDYGYGSDGGYFYIGFSEAF